jgi:hypothetical protein
VQEINNVGRRICFDSAQTSVLAAEEHERVPALGLVFMQLDYASDEDLVVAAIVPAVSFALERDHGIRQQRQACPAAQQCLPDPFLALGAREFVGLLLSLSTLIA